MTSGYVYDTAEEAEASFQALTAADNRHLKVLLEPAQRAPD